jgi:Bacteriophage HK97-gp10, putative tail-component
MADDGLNIEVLGVPELEALFGEMAGQEAEKICRKALRAGGNQMRAAIAINAPVRAPLPSGTALPPGALQSDITVTVTKNNDTSFSAWIEPGKQTMHVARWVEWGHRLVRGKTSRRRGTKGKEIGDVEAHPYIRPSFDANEDLAAGVVADAVIEGVDEMVMQRGLDAGR